MPSSEEWAWAAGFYEGEGSAYASKGGDTRRHLCLGLPNSDLEVLERFCGIVGGKIYPGARREGHRPMWLWRAARRELVAEIVEGMWPYLGSRRREQINAARELVAQNRPRRSAWPARLAKYGPSGRSERG